MENRPYHYHYGFAATRHSNETPVNIIETERAYILYLYAPSLAKENIIVATKNDILSIRYQGEKDTLNRRYTRREYRPEEIERSFDLKGKIDVDSIKASYAEGILTIELPKTDTAIRQLQEVSVR
ncbi:Hsp20/alpha crystallin family protein [Chitinophagaceae bacterium LB-8]|uniref:Hsp20/alpha crystallin family protein n=1 Tax=Paraflavisolibacter caeni TaxID=2982496 RepID=A0A9X3BGD1_9BACT|nr:Hsp20/alpha crystallin family protein [Paraflavisolibacter caeni]MCU7547583.1 Hsp20/alpha crystallin family protein [Paraflavisolibacter caeni]